MGASNDNRPFASDLTRILPEEIWHRCAWTPAERDAADWLRRQADDRRGLTGSQAPSRLHDKFLDDAPNAWVTTTFIASELASTLTIHTAEGETDYLPSIELFADVLEPLLRDGKKIVEATRVATQLQAALTIPAMPYIALRPSWLAAEYFGADFLVAMVCMEHQDFYRCALGYELCSEPRHHPHCERPISCMRLDFIALRERVEENLPYLRSSKAEQEALFRRWIAPRVVMANG
jgi:hypothetical protein